MQSDFNYDRDKLNPTRLVKLNKGRPLGESSQSTGKRTQAIRRTVLQVFVLMGPIGSLSSLSVKAQFTTTQIGGGATGSIVGNGLGSFTVIGGGNDIWGGSDAFTFHYFSRSGNFDLRARIESLQPNAPATKAGLMARETTAPNSRMAYCRVTPIGPTSNGQTGSNDVRFGYRTGTTSI